MRSKRILIINRTFPPSLGATGRVACDLALYLRKEGHDITILTSAQHPKTDIATRMKVVRIPTNQTPQSSWDYFKIMRQMNKAAKKLPKQDIVISMTDPPFQALFAAKLAKDMKARHIHWAMDLYPDLLPVLGKDMHPFFYRLAYNAMHKMMRKADAVVPISDCMARYLSHHSIPRNKMVVIENWPDKYLLEETDNPQSLMDDNKFRILYAGTIGLAHEFDIIISAATYFQKTDPDIEFVFTARGRGYDDFKRQCDNAGLRNIQFISPQPSKKLNALMNAGDIHLVTMKKAAAGKLFPSKFYSACAAGRPVIFIGPAACDIHKKISLSGCGATIRNGESRMLTNAIANYKNNPDEWFKACEAASSLMDNHTPLETWKALIARM